MNIASILFKEIRYRKRNFFWGVIAVMTAIGVINGAITIMNINRLVAEAAIEKKIAAAEKEMKILWDDMRRATLKLSFNLAILPEDTDLKQWHMSGESDHYMPEDYAHKIASSKILTVRHLLPVLQKRVLWPETGRTIILVGSRGEVPHQHKSPKAPLQQAVPEGKIVLGNELQKISGAKEGDNIELMGRSFTVHKIHDKRGSRDDITAWIPLAAAQEMLDKEGKINAIQALECLCSGLIELPDLRKDLKNLLPGIQVYEQGSKVIARAEARGRAEEEAKALIEREKEHRARLGRERQRSVAVLVPVVILAAAVWIGMLGYSNVKERIAEIAVLRAVGTGYFKVIALFLFKSLLFGLTGGTIGYFVGVVGGSLAGTVLKEGLESLPEWTSWLSWAGFAGSVLAAAMLAVLASWLPAFWATRVDPAEILWEE
ncbi:MAG: ABC transporter permease [Verrucomicrobiota bacterium]